MENKQLGTKWLLFYTFFLCPVAFIASLYIFLHFLSYDGQMIALWGLVGTVYSFFMTVGLIFKTKFGFVMACLEALMAIIAQVIYVLLQPSIVGVVFAILSISIDVLNFIYFWKRMKYYNPKE